MEDALLRRISGPLADRYRVEREIGRGGMAVVFLASDVRHDRDVAIKVLAPELAAVVGQERFLTEIRTTARLQHPHLLPLLDSGEADGLLYFVTPFVSGESLADRLSRERQLPVDEAVRIIRAVAGAVDHAHRNGIIHRDIKPSNILMQDGEPLVADFGIALATSAAGGRLTETGLSVGTPHYMSPEQATGDVEPGPATDVYALGCVLYEMLTGSPPFQGGTVQAILARILTEAPALPSRSRSSVPPHVEAAVLRALEKIPADRFASASDFGEGLADHRLTHPLQTARPAGSPPPGTARPSFAGWRSVLPWGVAAVLALVLALRGGNAEVGEPVPLRTTLPGAGFGAAHLSSDGRLLAERPDPTGPILIRALDDEQAVRIPVEGDVYPSGFSPDGRWLLIGGVSGLHRVPSEGGTPILVADVYTGSSAWNERGRVVYTGLDGIYSIPWDGGSATRVHDRGYLATGTIEFLPGDRWLLFTAFGPDVPSGSEIRVLDLSTGSVRTVLEDAVAPSFLPPDVLLFAQPGRGLQAVGFDPRSAETTGDRVAVIDSVATVLGAAAFTASDNGTVLARIGPQPPSSTVGQLALVDQGGGVEALPVRMLLPSIPRIAPGGDRIAYQSGDGRIRVFDRATGATGTLSETGTFIAAWHPSGDSLVVSEGLDGSTPRLTMIPLDGGPVRTVAEGPALIMPLGYASDGTRMLVQTMDASAQDIDLQVLDFEPEAVARPLLAAEWMEAMGALSPDDRWVAYLSGRDGVAVPVVRSMSGSEEYRLLDRDVDTSGMISPLRWSPDGRTVYWLDEEGVMAVPFRPAAADPVGTPYVAAPGQFAAGFDVHPDGRLLVARPILPGGAIEARDPSGLRTVLFVNWRERIREAAGRGR